MILAIKGTIHDNAIVPEDIMEYKGRDVIITILDFSYQKKKKIDTSYKSRYNITY